jgi:hypothetical protein
MHFLNSTLLPFRLMGSFLKLTFNRIIQAVVDHRSQVAPGGLALSALPPLDQLLPYRRSYPLAQGRRNHSFIHTPVPVQCPRRHRLQPRVPVPFPQTRQIPPLPDPRPVFNPFIIF